ncbi:hypothetical protein, partial [Streptococcus pyogenes]|uniref:hypothetical protein n=2 Tax=Streptococcus pyogenes TaxID=1314 RepID=UPI001D13204B
LLFLKDEFYSREFEGFIKGFSWHNDFSSFSLNFVSTLLYQVQLCLKYNVQLLGCSSFIRSFLLKK